MAVGEFFISVLQKRNGRDVFSYYFEFTFKIMNYTDFVSILMNWIETSHHELGRDFIAVFVKYLP